VKLDLVCHICHKDISEEDENVLVGRNEEGEYLSGHVSCLSDKGLDVCGDCMSIVPISKIVDKDNHICTDCFVAQMTAEISQDLKGESMKVYTCWGFTGHWPVGTSAVVVAGNTKDAVKLLEDRLAEIGLPQRIDPKSLVELDLTQPACTIINDGEY